MDEQAAEAKFSFFKGADDVVAPKDGAPFVWERAASRVRENLQDALNAKLTLPLFRVALNPRFTRPFYAVPRTSAARTASG